ncbi:hypothetical protein MMC18_000905 [Xylographa bjoerkii]|nr:hypothetical protein [Xylographa bjoerkii]
MLKCHEAYGDFVRYGPNKLIINDQRAIKDIYGRNANVQKSTAYRAFETSPTAHDTQSTVDKVQHARKRRVIGQAFSDSALRSFEEHVLEHIKIFVKCLSANNTGDETKDKGPWSPAMNIADLTSYVSFDLMAELVFGKAFRMLELVDNRFIIDLIKIAAFRVGVCLQMPKLAVWNMDKVFAPSVRKLRDQYVHTSRKMAMDRMEMESKRQDIFSHILAAKDPQTGEGFSVDEIWGESTLLIVAGSDAISTGLAGCFYYLSRNPEAYSKVCSEVRSRFSSADEIRTGPTLASCTYLRACIDEALRMSPPVGGALWREVCKGGLQLNGRIIPQGYDVGIGIYAIQHNPAYYPAPYTYRPERWLTSENNSQESVDLARAAFSAFSIGPVGCVGKNLAYMESMLTMARVLWTLDINYVRDVESERLKGQYESQYKDHFKSEYKLRDRFTSWKDGPMLSFRHSVTTARIRITPASTRLKCRAQAKAKTLSEMNLQRAEVQPPAYACKTTPSPSPLKHSQTASRSQLRLPSRAPELSFQRDNTPAMADSSPVSGGAANAEEAKTSRALQAPFLGILTRAFDTWLQCAGPCFLFYNRLDLVNDPGELLRFLASLSTSHTARN